MHQDISLQSSMNTMAVKLLLFINVAIAINNCQSTVSIIDDATREYELIEDIKSEMGSIRQLLVNLQQTAVRNENQMVQIVLKQHGNETQATQDMKTEIEEIRKLVLRQHANETQATQDMKTEIEEIGQIVIQEQNWSRSVQRKIACPLGFDYLPEAGRCFIFISGKMTWDEATARCRGIMPGVHLAAITSQEEQDAIVRYLRLQFTKNGLASPPYAPEDLFLNGVWISGQRRNTGLCDNPFVWKTLNGINIPFSFTRWVAGEPNCGNGADNEFCAHIVPGEGYDWNDGPCSTLYFPLCEF